MKHWLITLFDKFVLSMRLTTYEKLLLRSYQKHELDINETFCNWDSVHAKLDNHFEAWSEKKKEDEKGLDNHFEAWGYKKKKKIESIQGNSLEKTYR